MAFLKFLKFLFLLMTSLNFGKNPLFLLRDLHFLLRILRSYTNFILELDRCFYVMPKMHGFSFINLHVLPLPLLKFCFILGQSRAEVHDSFITCWHFPFSLVGIIWSFNLISRYCGDELIWRIFGSTHLVKLKFWLSVFSCYIPIK